MTDQTIHTEVRRKDPYFYGSTMWLARYQVKVWLSWDDVPKSNDPPGKVCRWRWAKNEYVWCIECGGLDDIAYQYYLDDTLPPAPPPRRSLLQWIFGT